jgi:hypothetical protein
MIYAILIVLMALFSGTVFTWLFAIRTATYNITGSKENPYEDVQ